MPERYFSGMKILPSQADTNSSLAFWATSKSLKYREDAHFSLLLNHSETYFPEFAFDILALLKGTYQPHVLSSLYCMGTTSQENGSCVETRYFDLEAVKRYREETAALLKAKGYEDFLVHK